MSTSRDYTAGQVLTAAQADDWSQGVIGFATPITSNVGPTSGTAELDIITAPAATVAATNRRLRISFDARGVSMTVATDLFILRIKEGSTILAEAHNNTNATSVTSAASNFSAYVSSPSAASHTYKATIQRSSGTGTATVSATATAPITLTVEDVGTV